MMMSCIQLIEIHRRHRLSYSPKIVKARHLLRAFAVTAPREDIYDNPHGKKAKKIPDKPVHNFVFTLATPNAPK